MNCGKIVDFEAKTQVKETGSFFPQKQGTD